MHHDLRHLYTDDQIAAMKALLKKDALARREFRISMQKLDELVAEREIPQPESHFIPSGVWRVPALEAFVRQLLP